jgi:hypothetical protein
VECQGAPVEPEPVTHYSDSYQPAGIMVLARNINDRERTGLRRLTRLCAECGRTEDQAAISRVWSKVRQTRNAEALARAKHGDSMGAYGSILDHSFEDQQRIVYGPGWLEVAGLSLTDARKVA